MMMNARLLPLLLAVAAPLVSNLTAQQVSSRAALNQILGTTQTTEAFEGAPFSSSGPALIAAELNRTTLISLLGTFGPDLVEAGANYRTGLALQWASATGGLTSKAIGYFLAPDMFIDYGWPVPACGMDVIIYGGGTFTPTTATVEFFDANGVMVGSLTRSFTSAGQYQFFGWQHPAGITSVRISGGTGFSNTPFIDNHTFGLSQSDASQLAGYGQGCNRWRESFYEFDPSFGLSGRTLQLNLNASSYVVQAGTTSVVPPTAAATPILNNSITAFPLGWTLPFPGGTTDTVYVGSNGFVRFVPGGLVLMSQFALLNQGPTISALGRTLAPEGGGTVTFETDAVAQTATVTFDQVPDGFGSGVNTFQYFFDGSGQVEVRFGVCAGTESVTGWSPGQSNLDPGTIDILSSLPIVLDPEDRQPLGLATLDYPFIGSTVNLGLVRVPAGSLATVHVIGFANASVELSALGMPDCFALSSLDFLHLTPTPVGTTSDYALTLPVDVSLVGLQFFAQGFALDPAGGHNSFGGLTSNGLRLDIGLF